MEAFRGRKTLAPVGTYVLYAAFPCRTKASSRLYPSLVEEALIRPVPVGWLG
ncbi:hypothetical protein AA0311_2182 [Asaia bogorensis NBRC 16594]|nr:hypothetical protein AA0311_2182 [Asaia bogorensis NBRC 16594]